MSILDDYDLFGKPKKVVTPLVDEEEVQAPSLSATDILAFNLKAGTVAPEVDAVEPEVEAQKEISASDIVSFNPNEEVKTTPIMDVFKPIEEPKPIESSRVDEAKFVLLDPLITGTEAMISAGEGAVGLADMVVQALVNAANPIDAIENGGLSGGIVARGLEQAGIFKPKAAKEYLRSHLSNIQKQSDEELAAADGFVETMQAYLENPNSALRDLAVSVGPMVVGGGAARKIIASFPNIPPILAAAVGEGLASMGSNYESFRQEQPEGDVSLTQAGPIAASGLATTLISNMGAKLASELGFDDIYVLLAGGKSVKTKRDIVSRVILGYAGEAGQEVPQSVVDQMATNIAGGKPILEGVDNVAAQSLVVGGLGGGLVNVPGPFRGRTKADILAEQEKRFDTDPAFRKQLMDAGINSANEIADEMEALQQFSKAMGIPMEKLEREIEVRRGEVVAGEAKDELYELVGKAYADLSPDVTIKIKLAKAEEMHNAGQDRLATWKETGWWWDGEERGWQYELDPNLVKVHPDGLAGVFGTTPMPLTDLVTAPELFAGAPYLTQHTVRLDPNLDARGEYNAKKQEIVINPNHPEYDKVGTLRHEIQHAIQVVEKQPSGTSPESSAVAAKVSDLQAKHEGDVIGRLAQIDPLVNNLLDLAAEDGDPNNTLSLEETLIFASPTAAVVQQSKLGDNLLDVVIQFQDPDEGSTANVTLTVPKTSKIVQDTFGNNTMIEFNPALNSIDRKVAPQTKINVYAAEMGEADGRLNTMRSRMTAGKRAATPPWQTRKEMLAMEKLGVEPWVAKDGNGNSQSANPQINTPAFKSWFGRSVVVNPDGTPKVVYHGSAKSFNEFSKEALGRNTGAPSAKQGFFFTSNPQLAGDYSGSAYQYESEKGLNESIGVALTFGGEFLYPYLKTKALNITYVATGTEEKPVFKVVKSGEAILGEEVKVVTKDKFYSDLIGLPRSSDGGVYPVYLAIKNPLIHDFNGEHYRDETYNNLITKAKQNGNDGVILKNTYDNMTQERDASDLYVAFEPAQIKSAIGNQGTYSPTDPNILNQTSKEGDVKGSFRLVKGWKRIVTLTKSATKETFLHELAHVFFTYLDIPRLGVIAKEANVSLDTLIKYNQGTELTEAEMAEVRKASELFANGWIRYLAEGVAPSAKLFRLFKRFSRMIREAIVTGQTEFGVDEISPELRKLYASIMISEEDVIGGSIQSTQLPEGYSLVAGGQIISGRSGIPSIQVRNNETGRTHTIDIRGLVPKSLLTPVFHDGLTASEIREEYRARSSGTFEDWVKLYKRNATRKSERNRKAPQDKIVAFLGKDATFVPIDYSSEFKDSLTIEDLKSGSYTVAELNGMNKEALTKLAIRIGVDILPGMTEADLINELVLNDTLINRTRADDTYARVSLKDDKAIAKIKEIISGYALNLINNLEFRFPSLKKYSRMAQRATDKAHAYLGDYAPLVKRIQELTNGIGTPDGWSKSSAEVRELMGQPLKLISEDGMEAWVERWRILSDKRYAKLRPLIAPATKEELEVFSAMKDLYDAIGKSATEDYFMFEGKLEQGLRTLVPSDAREEGKKKTKYDWEVKKTTPDLVSRISNQEFNDILYGGDPRILNDLSRTIAAVNDSDATMFAAARENVAKTILRQLSKDARNQKQTNLERISTIAIMPSHFRSGGRVHHILESDPYAVAHKMATAAALRFGYLSEFDTDTDVTDKMITNIQTLEGSSAAKDMTKLMLALNGAPIYDNVGGPGSLTAGLLSGIRSIASLKKALYLSGSVITNLPEPMTKLPSYAGAARLVKVQRDLTKALGQSYKTSMKNLGKKVRISSEFARMVVDMERQGWVSFHVSNAIVRDVVNNMGQQEVLGKLADMSKIATDRILTYTGVIGINEWNEIVAALTGKKFAEDIVAGRLAPDDYVRLNTMGFNSADIEKMRANDVEGKKLLRSLPQRLVSITQNTNLLPAEVSKVGNWAYWKDLAFADNFSRNTLGRLVMLGHEVVKSEMQKKNPKSKLQAYGQLSLALAETFLAPLIANSAQKRMLRSYVGNHATAGLFVLAIRNFMKFGLVAALYADWDDDDDGIPDGIVDVLQDSMMAGVFGGFWFNLYGQLDRMPSTGNVVGDAAIAAARTTFIGGEIEKLYSALEGVGRYRDLDGLGRLAKYSVDSVPPSQYILNLLAMVAGNENAEEFRYAEREHYKFMDKNAPKFTIAKTEPDGGRSESVEAKLERRKLGYMHLKKAELAMKATIKGDPHSKEAMNHLRLAERFLNDSPGSFNSKLFHMKHTVPVDLQKKYEKEVSKKSRRILERYNTLVDRNGQQ